MNFFQKISNKLSDLGMYLAVLVLVALTLLILVEVLGRAIFDYSTMIADEYSGYFLLALSFLGFAYTLKEQGHIRINLLTSKLNKKAKKIMAIVAGILGVGTVIYALVYSIDATLEAKELEMLSEAVSQTPIYLTQIPVCVGLSILAIALLAFVAKRIKDDI